MIQKKLQYVSIGVIFAMLVGAAIIPYSTIAFAQQSQNTSSKTSSNTTPSTSTTGATTNKTALLKPGNPAAINVALAAKMLQLLSSNKPKDIATLAYIWGYPLVTGEVTLIIQPRVFLIWEKVQLIQSTLPVRCQILVGYNMSVQM